MQCNSLRLKNLTDVSREEAAETTDWYFLLLYLLAFYAYIKLFHFFSGPGSFPKECEARFDAGIKSETPDVNDTAEVFPPEIFNKFSQDHFQRFSMKRIF
jgi:hypothetical protein